MKKTLLTLILLFSFAYVSAYAPPPSIAQTLVNKATRYGSQRVEALLLLRHIRLDEKLVKKLEELYNKETIQKHRNIKLLIAEVFKAHAIGNYDADFIELFPNNASEADKLFDLMSKTDYLYPVGSPILNSLIVLADNNEQALVKLLSIRKTLYAADADQIFEAILDIKKRKPKYVEEVSRKNNIDFNILGTNK